MDNKNELSKHADPGLYMPINSVLSKERVHLLEQAGPINFWTEKGSQAGCLAVHFVTRSEIYGLPAAPLETFNKFLNEMYGVEAKLSPFDLLNAFFQWQGNMQLVDWKLTTYGISILVNNYLDKEEWEQRIRHMERARELIEEEDARNAKAKAEADAEAAKKAAAMKEEADKLLALGKKAIDHGWLEQLEKLKAENATLRKELRNATKGK